VKPLAKCGCVLALFCMIIHGPDANARTMTYNSLAQVSLRDRGFPADERSTHALIASGNAVYGATSGDKCHIFRFVPASGDITILATIDGPNTVLKGFVLDGTTLYAGTMLNDRQKWLEGRRRGGTHELVDVNLYEIQDSWNTGHLYRITGIDGDNPELTDLGIPVSGEGIHTMTIDSRRGLIYGLTTPTGRFFIYDIANGTTETVTFGTTYSYVSNHMIDLVEVDKDLTDFTPGEVESRNKIIARAMHVMPDGRLFTSGWDGRIVRYDPGIADPEKRFTPVAVIPCVPGRRYWNRIDEIIEKDGRLFMGSSDGYIFEFDPATSDVKNYGKPIRAIEVMAMTFSSLDGNLYGINGGDLDGISRFWCFDSDDKTFEVDYPAAAKFKRRPMADMVCTDKGTIVIAETERVADLWVLTPGEPKEWAKTEIMEPLRLEKMETELIPEKFVGHTKKLEVDLFPIPSDLQGGSGYTALQFDRGGNVYVGTAYYGRYGTLARLDPSAREWDRVFRTDELTKQYGRGMGIPGKIHTKLRLGSDGKLYGAMKQGYEWGYDYRPDVGESPEGKRGGEYTCHMFSYDPESDVTVDLGPAWPQNGVVGFCVDVERGYIYGTTVPNVYFIVYDMKTGRCWNAGAIASNSPARYMAIDYDTGRVYHRGEVTPSGSYYMTVWDPDEFRLRDYEVVSDGSFKYRHSYTITCGSVGSNKLYGADWTPNAFEMDLNIGADNKLHAHRICDVGPGGKEEKGYMNCIELGPDGRLYWGVSYGYNGPIAVMSWDPATETRTYLGTLTLGGEYLVNAVLQGIALDSEGNLAIQGEYIRLTENQKKLAHWQPGKDYSDIEEQPYYRGFPAYNEGTFYSIIYIEDATDIR